jgi:CRISPR-associated endonuclease/helicase Cas3
MEFYAHSRKDAARSTWQELRAHLEAVADLASQFVPHPWKPHARIAGLWHDLGKYQIPFQRYIEADPDASNEATGGQRVEHAIVGAAQARCFDENSTASLPIALAVQAHHGALKSPSGLDDAVANRGRVPLSRLEADGAPKDLLEMGVPPLPETTSLEEFALATRFLFSALVDADSLDTEQWDIGAPRAGEFDSIATLASKTEEACAAKSLQALKKMDSPLNRMRSEVLQECLASAELAPGLFTLTVPTGGGKTLSGLAFALRHAALNGLARVIFVAPYTSILEQTVSVFRAVLGERNVIEHHSNIDPDRETDRNRQACENWDAPVIVTTSVQFFETLYANDKRRCRKLHRIGRSVVFLDEVQTFPEHLLRPIHSVLNLLTERFGTSVVHSTATQPRLTMRAKTDRAPLQVSREVVPRYALHFPIVANRFRMEVLGNVNTEVEVEQLAMAVGQHERVLVIVHRRKEAEDLARLLGSECLHLSARMCAEHRTSVLEEVRRRLTSDLPCRLVATQLVEAGVDLDFPVVFRALAGLETLAQAAGRCNREMTLPAPGRFIVFRAASKPPAAALRRGLAESLDFFEEGLPDLADPEIFPRYAKRLMSSLGQDGNDTQQVLAHERQLDFPEVSARFRMIEDTGQPVVADYGDAWDRVRELRRPNGVSRQAFRRLQRYTVSLQPQEISRLQQLGVLEPLLYRSDDSETNTSWVLKQACHPRVYDPHFGFGWQGGERYEPDGLFA